MRSSEHDWFTNHVSALFLCLQEDRMQTVASIVRSIQELMEELQISPTTPLDNRVLGSLAIPSAEGIPILQTTEVFAAT